MTLRSTEYSIIVALAYNSEENLGSACDAYADPFGKYMVDTSEWHDYAVTVHKDYSYDLYVDGKLAWEGAPVKKGGSPLIKIGSAHTSEEGTGLSDLEIDSFRLEYGIHVPA